MITTPADYKSLGRLAELRYLHQTRRAAKSVRSGRESKVQEPGAVRAAETSATTKRQQICSQMADIIQRAGTGLEQCVRWKSAPRAMDPSEVSELKGNSTNAELAAKDRVRMVSDSDLLSSVLSCLQPHSCTGARPTKQAFYRSHRFCKTPCRWVGWFCY